MFFVFLVLLVRLAGWVRQHEAADLEDGEADGVEALDQGGGSRARGQQDDEFERLLAEMKAQGGLMGGNGR